MMVREKKTVPTIANLGDDDNSGDFEPVRDDLDIIPDTSVARCKVDDDQLNPEWTDQVLAQLADKEKYDGNPKVAGLKRLVGKLLGPIIEMDTEFIEVAIGTNGYRCSAKHVIVVRYPNGELRRFAGSADSSPRNTDQGFENFPVAMAETRAKGRAYINALGIQCNASEEMAKNPAIIESLVQDRMTDAQLQAIDIICKKTDINAGKFIKSKYPRLQKMSDLTKPEATALIKALNAMQNEATIDPDLSGYKNSWCKQEN
jgi:hypothetical protein